MHDVPVDVVAERVQYYGKDGKLITESLNDYTRKAVNQNFASLNDFLRKWTSADRKQAIVEELENEGILLEALAEEVGKDFDPFDLIAHVAFGQKPLTRRERAENVKKQNYFVKYGDKARAVLEALLDKYADEGSLIWRIRKFSRCNHSISTVRQSRSFRRSAARNSTFKRSKIWNNSFIE